MKLKHLQHIVLCLCGWWIGLTACQSAYEGEEEAETSSQSLHVTARAEGTSAHLTYPAYILAFNEQGDYVARQILTGPDSPVELKLKPQTYTLVALAGLNEEYVLPDHPRLTDVISMKEGNRSGRALMMGRTPIQIQSGKQVPHTVNISLSNVVSLVNVTLEGIPSYVKQLKLQLAPVYAALSLQGEYTLNNQTVEVTCSPASEGVWIAEPFYVFPGCAPQTIFNILMEDEKGIQTYSYTFKGYPQANVPFHIKGAYQGEVSLEGSLLPSDWETPVEVPFEFGLPEEGEPSSPGETTPSTPTPPVTDTEQLPAIGSIWNQGIVVAHVPGSLQQSTQIVLLSLQEWSAFTSQAPAIIQENAAEGWHLPTEAEARSFRQVFTESVLTSVNQALARTNPNLPLLDTQVRYLSDHAGSFYTYSFKPNSKYLIAGQKVSYKLRFLRQVPWK